MTAAIERNGNTLSLSGPITGATVAALHAELLDVHGVSTISLQQVSEVDTVGVALISQLVARTTIADARPHVLGMPKGLSELCQAYRIAPDFSDFP
ncbi:MAG: hypothetical protein COW59_10460 [Lysobacterales bacterium CG17_big_fil_post_rev_8_21_14_2_50_64_11]|nr:MAG: hypothetical protein COW59_10460 [Xanthomonadales bacterium CG17_big_fil_post_rev_8_21_14_2_50_64_11]PIX59684.1 MAG: hypothetical protein COZ47_11200 [Xanthomonadales bacterium CG_4_10_14_3_um_filter_64_11]